MKEVSRNIPSESKKQVRERDKNKCRKCGMKKGLEFHHIIPFFEVSRESKFSSQIHKKENIILLCNVCHTNAPDDPFDFFKWLMVYPNLPVSYSTAIDLIKQGLPMLILKREKEYLKEYQLSRNNEDWKVLSEDMEVYFRDLWECQIEILNRDKGSVDGVLEPIGNLFNKYFPKILTNSVRKDNDGQREKALDTTDNALEQEKDDTNKQ